MDNYLLAKKIVEEKYSKNYKHYPLLVLSVYGLLSKFDKNIVRDVFKKTTVYIEKGPISEIIKRHKLMNLNYDDSYDDTEIHGISNQGYNYIYDEDGKIIEDEKKPFIICARRRNITKLLIIFTHEMAHLIKNYINDKTTREDDTYITIITRSGVNYYTCKYNKKTTDLESFSNNEILDENINTIQTTEMMEEIKALDGIVPDEEIIRLLCRLDKDFMSEDYGYDETTKYVRILWNNKHFKEIIEKNIVEGNVKEIIRDFDNILGKGSFKKLSKLLDIIDSLNGESCDLYIKELIQLINNYNSLFKLKKI